MKKLLSILFLCVTLTTVFAADGNDKDGTEEKESREVYCMIVGTAKAFSQKVTIQIDYGQGINKWKPKQSMLSDEDGKPVVLNSMIDALNFMANDGWVFVNAYAVTMGNSNVYHWLLKREE